MKIFDRIKKIFKPAKLVANFLLNTIILTFVYFLGVGTTFVVTKITKRKLLSEIDTTKDSYWEDVQSDINYYQQF